MKILPEFREVKRLQRADNTMLCQSVVRFYLILQHQLRR